MPNEEVQKNVPTSFSNPYNWWGFGLIIIGLFFGGLIGGLIGTIACYAIRKVGKKDMPHAKKIVINLLITIGGILVSIGIAYIGISIFS